LEGKKKRFKRRFQPQIIILVSIKEDVFSFRFIVSVNAQDKDFYIKAPPPPHAQYYYY